MSLLNFTKNSLFSKSLIKSQNTTAMLKFPQNVDEGHFMRFHFIEFPDVTTRMTRGPQTMFDQSTGQSGPRTFGTSSIFLYMPQDLAISNGHEWENVNLNMFGKTIEELNNRASDNTSLGVLKSYLGVGVEVAKQAVYSVSGFDNIKAASFRVVLNPFKDVLYTAPQLRTFNFKWILVPQSEEDCNTIKNIMDSFKYHAAPSKKNDSGLSVLGFPGAFEVSFHSYNAAFNQYLPQIGYSIITNVTSNYTPSSMFAAYRNGHPTEVELTLEMQEIQLLTREELYNENPNSMAAQLDRSKSDVATNAPPSSVESVAVYQESTNTVTPPVTVASKDTV